MEEFIEEILSGKLGRLLGALAGLVLALFILWFGVLGTLFIACCVVAGYLVGYRIDTRRSFHELLDKFFPRD